jgi:hypothetical protein
MERSNMSKIATGASGLEVNAILPLLVMLLTVLIIIFSTYMSAVFWSGLGVTVTASITFLLLGIFLELAKVCASIAAIFAYNTKNHKLMVVSVIVVSIFTLTSFTASVGTISEQIKAGKVNSYENSAEVKIINAAIARQEQIIASLLLSQRNDLEHNYRARSNATLLQIKQEQGSLDQLYGKLNNTKITELTVSNVISIFNTLIPLGQDQLENFVTLILGALTEITSLFLLYLNFSLKCTTRKENRKSQSDVKSNIIKALQPKFPISDEDYNKLTDSVIRGIITPNQRELKKAIKLGNEKISRIFSRWIEDGILIKTGKSYRVAA